MTLAGKVPAATFDALPDHHPIIFGGGSIGVELAEAELHWVVFLGARPTADLLAEMVAALVYHYDPDTDGGTAITDVCINDGDFAVKRRPDGSFDLRLTAARRREAGIGPNLFLLYLIDSSSRTKTGASTVARRPPDAHRIRPSRSRASSGASATAARMGRRRGEGPGEALRSMAGFGPGPPRAHSSPGWIASSRAAAPATFGHDPGRHRSRSGRCRRSSPSSSSAPARRARQRPRPEQERSGGSDRGAKDAASARALKICCNRLSLGRPRSGRRSGDGAGRRSGRKDLLASSSEAEIPAAARDRVAKAALAESASPGAWNSLVAKVPGARGLRQAERPALSVVSFRRPIRRRREASARRRRQKEVRRDRPRPPTRSCWARRLRLPFGDRRAHVPEPSGVHGRGLHESQVGLLQPAACRSERPTTSTRPEHCRPTTALDGGRAFELWREMLARGELLGDGHLPDRRVRRGRRAPRPGPPRRRPAHASDNPQSPSNGTGEASQRLDYRVYETLGVAADRQRELLGGDAIVAEGTPTPRTLKTDSPPVSRVSSSPTRVPDAFSASTRSMLDGQGTGPGGALVVPAGRGRAPQRLGDALAAASPRRTRRCGTVGFATTRRIATSTARHAW